MSGTSSTTSSSNLAINSSENISTTGNSTATPIIIGASVASVALFLSIVFLVFYFVRRRRSEYNYYNDKTEFNLYPTYKEDSLPPEPSPPPLPYKDIKEKDLESGMKPLLPPKDTGRPFVKSKRAVEHLQPMQQTLANQPIPNLPTFPERTFSRTEDGMF